MTAMLLPITYHLEIYQPDSLKDVAATFTSCAPFQPITAGDIINPVSYNDDHFPPVYLRAVNVEHVIWQNEDHIGHKILVFTEMLDEAKALSGA